MRSREKYLMGGITSKMKEKVKAGGIRGGNIFSLRAESYPLSPLSPGEDSLNLIIQVLVTCVFTVI